MGCFCKNVKTDCRFAVQPKFDLEKFEIHLKRAWRATSFMAARKPGPRKTRLMKKIKQASPVPAWIIVRTKRTVRTNPKRRAWRRTDVGVG